VDHEQLKHSMDSLSLFATIGTLIGWLPAIACVLSIVWTSIRIYEWAADKFWRN
jgi:hypothetical protein